MATYLLLRSNKETGPYTREQLQQLGLKPYDLVWVEGKSAAWRYPGEVAELKEFSPVVEEQPFDRFYRQIPDKAEKHFHELIEEARKKEETLKVAVLNTEKTPVKVFVSMPGDQSKSAPVVAIKKQEPLLVAEEKKELVIPVVEKKEFIIPVEQKKETVNPVVKMEQVIQPEKEVELKEEYSQPLSEIKKQYAEIYLNRKQKTASRKSRIKIFQLAGAAVFVLALGMLIYFTIRPDKEFIKPANPVSSNSVKQETPDQTILPAQQSQPVSDEKSNKITLPPADNESRKQAIPQQSQPPVEEKDNSVVKTETTQENTNPPQENKQTESQRNKSTRNDAEETKVKQVNINSLVTVKANEYKRKAFGGIENLQLTVVNSSSFIVDKVVVELQYLKPSEQPLKTESIQFNSIAPNGSMTIKIPDNPRGIKIAYKILQVESTQYDKSTAGL